MPTKSIYKNINITDEASAERFISALEKAQNISPKEITLSQKYSIIDKDKIREIFGNNTVN